MKPFQREFIEFCVKHGVLRFGSFTLKSGRVSPFFFNAGLFHTGEALAELGRFYAAAVQDNAEQLPFDALFGPAYKGIPLVSTLAIALATRHGRDVPYSFNRKEAKDHGEGGVIVGAPIRGRILIVDDVMTAGTAIRESMALLGQFRDQAQLAGVLIALDRQEIVSEDSSCSATQLVARDYGVPVVAIVSLENVVEYLAGCGDTHAAHLEALRAYRERYGATL